MLTARRFHAGDRMRCPQWSLLRSRQASPMSWTPLWIPARAFNRCYHGSPPVDVRPHPTTPCTQFDRRVCGDRSDPSRHMRSRPRGVRGRLNSLWQDVLGVGCGYALSMRLRFSTSRWTCPLFSTSAVILRCAWSTVVWSRPPNCSPTCASDM